jgi:hypothetical protein
MTTKSRTPFLKNILLAKVKYILISPLITYAQKIPSAHYCLLPKAALELLGFESD